jgi:hypothetical protein
MNYSEELDLKNEELLQYSLCKEFFGKIEFPTASFTVTSEYCADSLKFYILKNRDKINVKYFGKACSISLASAYFLSKHMEISKNLDDLKKGLNCFIEYSHKLPLRGRLENDFTSSSLIENALNIFSYFEYRSLCYLSLWKQALIEFGSL